MSDILDNMPKSLSGKYRCTMRVYDRFGDWAASYEVIGAKGAVHYHVSRWKGSDGIISYSSGLEYHYRSPPDYMQDKPPSHDECHLLKSPCWHDGTSLYASEVYEPLFRMSQHESIFWQLERDAENAFNPVIEETP